MDETKPANEGNEQGLNKIDLSQLQDFTFGTQWTEVKPLSPRRERDDRRERRDDGPRQPGSRDRRAFRKPPPAPGADAAAQRDRPSQGFGGGDRRERQGGEGFRGGPRRDYHGGDRRDFRGERREGAGFERGPYISPYFTMTCYPEDAGFAALVKAVRASCRTFQLFEITKAVLEKNDRFVVVVQRKSPASGNPGAERSAEQATPPESTEAKPVREAPIYMSVPDHLPFDSEEAAIQHVMSNHLATFFATRDVEIDPPKGNFPIINRCGVTGELLGPPNYHRYQQILQQHHASRLPRMSFERFREKIESLREPEIVEQWLNKMRKATRYTWVYGQKPAAAPAAETTTAPAAETAAAPAEQAPAGDPAEPAPAAAAPAQDSASDASAPAASSEAPAAHADSPAPAGPEFDSFDDARAYLLAHARDKVVRAVETVRFHGRLIEKLPPGEIRRAIEGHVERQRRFPLDTANALRGRLRREGFTIFKKGSRGVSYVCAVKRRFRVPGQVFSDSISSLIDFVEKHPMVHVKELPKEFLGIDVAAVIAATPLPESMPASQTPFAVLPAEQSEKLRRMNNDLRWLVTEGYVTEFSDGKLFAPPPMTAQSQKRAGEHGEEHDPVDFPEGRAPSPAPAPAEPQSEMASETTPAEASDDTSAAPASTEDAAGPEPSAAAPEDTAPSPESAGSPVSEPVSDDSAPAETRNPN